MAKTHEAKVWTPHIEVRGRRQATLIGRLNTGLFISEP